MAIGLAVLTKIKQKRRILLNFILFLFCLFFSEGGTTVWVMPP